MRPSDGISNDILNDFVTESRELIETTDQHLVALEQRPADGELINGQRITLDHPDFGDAMGELANMVAGNAKAEFTDQHLSIG
ncbi:MAG: hypothetical protein WC058_05070 [Phycisphaeraceae bacterium]